MAQESPLEAPEAQVHQVQCQNGFNKAETPNEEEEPEIEREPKILLPRNELSGEITPPHGNGHANGKVMEKQNVPPNQDGVNPTKKAVKAPSEQSAAAAAAVALKKARKAVRRACEGGDVDAALKEAAQHPNAMGDWDTLRLVMSALIKNARISDATRVLQTCGADVTLSMLLTVAPNLPQSRSLREDALVGFIQSVFDAARLTLAEQHCRRFLSAQLSFILLEFAGEATQAHGAIALRSLDELIFSGRAAVVQFEPGMKKHELSARLIAGGSEHGQGQRGFESGDTVGLRPLTGVHKNDLDKLELIEAEVVLGMPFVLRMPTPAAAAELCGRGGQWAVYKLASRISMSRQLAALKSFAESASCFDYCMTDGLPPLPPKGAKESLPTHEMLQAITGLACESKEARIALCTAAVSPNAGVRGEELAANLNPSQRRAVVAAASNRLTLVQGPPGTGKTKVALTVLDAWVRCRVAGTDKILATSDSNIAVDNLLAGLVEMGVRAVRLGRPDNVRPELLRYCVEYTGESDGNKQSEFQARQRAIRDAQVICATCIGVGSESLDRIKFRAVLVDEATQATEASTLVSLCRSTAQAVLVGDQCQLPPTVVSQQQEAQRAARPLFSRLVDEGVPVHLLDTQYRMHPALSQLPSDLFYAGRISDGVTSRERPPPRGFAWPEASSPVAFVPMLNGSEETEGTSKINRAEARQAAALVSDLLYAGELRPSDIGLISPYAAQARLLRSMLRGEVGAQVEVSSVDGFQGREKEVIIFSCVRANNRGELGFLSDARRANVALTRGRRGMIVIGHANTLAMSGNNSCWARWLQWARSCGLVVGEPPSGSYNSKEARLLSSRLMLEYAATVESAEEACAPAVAACIDCQLKPTDADDSAFVQSHLQRFNEENSPKVGSKELLLDAAPQALRCRACYLLDRDTRDEAKGRSWSAADAVTTVELTSRPFGMTRVTDEDEYIVDQAKSGLPADVAGVRTGWRVSVVDGKDVRGENQEVVRELLKQARRRAMLRADTALPTMKGRGAGAFLPKQSRSRLL